MSQDAIKSLENALAQVKQDRRGFLKTLLVGSAVAAVPPLTKTTPSAGASSSAPTAERARSTACRAARPQR